MNKFNQLKKIQIPIIQRDYVQAREDDKKAQEVIDKFLEDLFNNLIKHNKFHLDFVYGYYEQNTFIPIDGQQRLTTLFLLHWYFTKKEDKIFENRLLYETRTSSREFCEFILDLEIDFTKQISSQVEDNKNFNPYWKYDPTIQSMLKVLDKIDEKANEYENFHFDLLDNITFEIFEMADFGEIQAEELYRKMNSRGKSLTPFENFKSIFEKIAHSFSKEKYQEIAIKFEKDWINHFWIDDIEKIDDYIMNFVYYITEMRYYENAKKDNEIPNFKSFIFLENFYKDKDNFDFLEKCFDNLKTIKQLSLKVEEGFIFFDTDKQVNLFDEAVKDNINILHKTLFYILILSLNEKYILDLLRIVRNVLNRERAFRTGQIIYAQTIDTKDIVNLIPKFKLLINKNNPYDNLNNLNEKQFLHEKEKLQYLPNYKKELFELEDYRYIKGDLRLLLSITNIENLYKLIIQDKIFEDKNIYTTLRALLSFGDYSIWIGSVKRGSKYFFGDKNYMEILLTENNKTKEHKKIYKSFFEKLKKQTVEVIIATKLSEYKNKQKDWIYYFMKYPSILNNKYKLINIFGFMKWNDNEEDYSYTYIEKLDRVTRISDRHINIYLLCLLDAINETIDFKKLEFDEDYGYTLNYDSKFKIEENYIVVNGKKIDLFGQLDAIEESKSII